MDYLSVNATRDPAFIIISCAVSVVAWIDSFFKPSERVQRAVHPLLEPDLLRAMDSLT
jgi:hypothetical protein